MLPSASAATCSIYTSSSFNISSSAGTAASPPMLTSASAASLRMRGVICNRSGYIKWTRRWWIPLGSRYRSARRLTASTTSGAFSHMSLFSPIMAEARDKSHNNNHSPGLPALSTHFTNSTAASVPACAASSPGINSSGSRHSGRCSRGCKNCLQPSKFSCHSRANRRATKNSRRVG